MTGGLPETRGRSSRRDVGGALATSSLSVATAAGMTWAVASGGWVHGPGPGFAMTLVLAGVLGVAEAGALAVIRVNRLVAILAVPGCCAITVAVLTVGSMPGESNFRDAAGHYREALVSGLTTGSDWSFWVALCLALWLCGYWLGWLAIRERADVTALVPVLTVLGINALNAPRAADLVVPTLVAMTVALLLIAQSYWRRVAPRRLRGGVFAPGAISAVVATVVVTGLLPPATSHDISSVVFRSVAQWHGPNSPDPAGGRATSVPPVGPPAIASLGAPVGFALATIPGGSLSKQSLTVLRYTSSVAAPVYLRMVADTVFEAGNWYPVGRDDRQGSVAAPSGRLPRSSPTALRDIGTHRLPVSIRVVPMGAASVGSGIFPGEPAGSSLDSIATGVVELATGSLLSVDYTTPSDPAAERRPFTAEGTVSLATAAELRRAGTEYPPFALVERGVPGDATGGAAILSALAHRWIGSAPDPYDQAVAIEARLRDPHAFHYTLDPPPTPRGQWPIVYFAATSHQGYCQYFASTMATMLRLLDIPARVIVGYGPGAETNPGVPSPSRTVTTDDAHSWVEAYFPGLGWIPFEPTPPSTLGDYQPLPRGALAATAPAPTATAAPPSAPGPASRAPRVVSASSQAVRRGGGWAAVLAGIWLVGLMAAAVAAGWFVRPRDRSGVWRRVGWICALLGLHRGAWETHREFARRVSDVMVPGGGAAVTAASALVELAEIEGMARYAPNPLDAAQERRLRRCWGAVVWAAPAMVWQRARKLQPLLAGPR